MHGFSYVTIAGPDLVHIASQHVEPHHRTSLKLAEASALTFRKRQLACSFCFSVTAVYDEFGRITSSMCHPHHPTAYPRSATLRNC